MPSHRTPQSLANHAQSSVALRREVQSWKNTVTHTLPLLPSSTLGLTRHNVTILDEAGDTVLQRIAPTSLSSMNRMNRCIREGAPLKDLLFNGTEPGERYGSQCFNLGIWNQYGSMGFPKEMEVATELKMPMLNWASGFFRRYISSLKPLLQADFLSGLEQRLEGHQWLKSKMDSPDHAAFCTHWWSTMTVIRGFTTDAHRDKQDQVPSMLVNFGIPVILCLTEVGLRIKLNPGDVVFFNAHLRHKVDPFDPQQDPESRWAVAFFFRTSWVNKVGDSHIINLADIGNPEPPAGPSGSDRIRLARAL